MVIGGMDSNTAAGKRLQRVLPHNTGSAQATSTTGAAPTGTNVSSNDFLKLLVTEMKNQDPTQPTDPNAYIQQLVGVNSLQQLIAINGELGAKSPAASPAATTSTIGNF